MREAELVTLRDELSTLRARLAAQEARSAAREATRVRQAARPRRRKLALLAGALLVLLPSAQRCRFRR